MEFGQKYPPASFLFSCVSFTFFFLFPQLHWWSFNGGATADRRVDRQNHRENVRRVPIIVTEVFVFIFELCRERNEAKPKPSRIFIVRSMTIRREFDETDGANELGVVRSSRSNYLRSQPAPSSDRHCHHWWRSNRISLEKTWIKSRNALISLENSWISLEFVKNKSRIRPNKSRNCK